MGHLDPDTGKIVPNHRKGNKTTENMSVNAPEHCIVAATGIEKLSSQRISELLTRITPSLQQDFFSKWARLNRQDGYYAMDITSVSSYSEFIDFMRWGL